jgi:hypothetical protein
MCASTSLWSPPASAGEAKAATRPPLTIRILISARNDACYDRGDIAAIKKLTRQERRRINAQGGIAGSRLDLEFLDDERDDARAIENVRGAISDPRTLAIIGMSNSNRATAVFKAEGAAIRQSGVPFISDISINSIFADAPNVFTTRASQDDERIPVIAAFLKGIGASRPAFVGISDSLFSDTLAKGLARAAPDAPLVADHRVNLNEGKSDPVKIDAIVADLKAKNPDLVFLTIGSRRAADFMKALVAAGLTPPLFITGNLERIPADVVAAYPSNLYQVAWDDLPDVYSSRLRRAVSLTDPERWQFARGRNASAPGWETGACKDLPDETERGPLSDANLQAIRIGGQFADMIGLVAAAARTARLPVEPGALRAHIVEQLKTVYAAGHGTYRGRFDNWSFRPATRAAARTPFIVQLTPGLSHPQLAPVQFVRLRNGTLREVPTLYLDLDLVRAFRIDDNEKSFYAEFYLAMHDEGKGASIDRIDFANAFLDPDSNERQLNIRTLNEGGRGGAYPDDMKIYHVAGRFMFTPRLANYPFDTQRFSIDIRPKRDDTPFIVQPPPPQFRDHGVVADGWQPLDQYVGFDEDFVSSTDAKNFEQSVVPFYRASFVWLMERQTTDYFLRVVVPLAFILIVAYLSVFIPREHFEAIVTIQVTALLSAVALYLALPKIDADSTTISDRIFLFIYMAVSLMIGISIARVSPLVSSRPWLRRVLRTVHVVAIPLLGVLMTYWVYSESVTSV